MGISCPLAIAMEVGIAFIPRSPRWLMIKSIRSDPVEGPAILTEAKEALQFFRRSCMPATIQKELDTIYDNASSTVATHEASVLGISRFSFPLITGCGLVICQQVTGQSAVLYNMANIFKRAGFDATAGLSSVSVGVMKLIATLLLAWRVDQYKRRFLLFVGISIMALALTLLAVAFHFEVCAEPGVRIVNCSEDSLGLRGGWGYITIAAAGLYVSGYQVGFGFITGVIVSEVFPLSIRGSALSVAVVLNGGFNILMTSCQPSAMSSLTISGTFFLYFVMCLPSLIFVKTIVPETQGLSLEQIETLLTKQEKRIETPV